MKAHSRLYICVWPNDDVSFVYAEDRDHLFDLLDEVADPYSAICEPFDAPLAIHLEQCEPDYWGLDTLGEETEMEIDEVIERVRPDKLRWKGFAGEIVMSMRDAVDKVLEKERRGRLMGIEDRYSRETLEKRFRQHGLPEYMFSGLELYVRRGVLPGSFLTALLRNDLHGSFRQADPTNSKLIREWVLFLQEHVQAMCWGSRERVREWVYRDGLEDWLKKKEKPDG